MSLRLSLIEFVGRGQAMLTGVTVSDSYARIYLTDFAKRYPAVWVLAQRLRKTAGDDGGGLSGRYHQDLTVEIVLRVVVQRYADGQTNVGANLNTLVENVIDAFVDWSPTGALPLVLVSTQDGPAQESVAYADVVFSTQVTHSRAA
jgi:hypothetical protein